MLDGARWRAWKIWKGKIAVRLVCNCSGYAPLRWLQRVCSTCCKYIGEYDAPGVFKNHIRDRTEHGAPQFQAVLNGESYGQVHKFRDKPSTS